MRIRQVLIASHFAVAAATVSIAFIGGQLFSDAIALFAALVFAAIVCFLPGEAFVRRMNVAFNYVEKVLGKGDAVPPPTSSIREFDELTKKVQSRVYKWADAAANAREQTRDIEQLLKRLNRRAMNGSSRSAHQGQQLTQLLASIAHSSDAELTQILECTENIERYARDISEGAELQTEAVNKTTTYVEQMSSNIDSVSENADAAKQASVTTRDSAASALTLVRELVGGMDRIRSHVETSESRLRALGDHSQEIGSIVETIGSISSRTDMLALNASIESVRAGEHGRGFAVVAEEVRKLAEQAAQATREVAGLIESIQLETQESIALMAEEREEVQEEVKRVSAAGEALQRINQVSDDSARRVGEITDATQLQLQLTRDVVLAVERIAEVAKSNRHRAEQACWTVNTLTKLTEQFGHCLQPLRACDESRVLQAPAAASASRDESADVSEENLLATSNA